MLNQKTSLSRGLAGGALCAAMLTAPAAAHDVLEGAEPAAGATVSEAPEQITLTYSDEVQKVGNRVSVADASGSVVAEGEPTATGREVTFDLPADLAPGTYTTTWRVVSSDGHPISGETGFTVAGASSSTEASSSPTASASSAPSEASSAPAASASSAPATDATGSTDPSPEPTASTSPSADAEASDSSGNLGWWIGLGALGALVLGIGAWVLSRR